MSQETTNQTKSKVIKNDISFTSDEFNSWVNAGLIPKEIIEKQLELTSLWKNKNKTKELLFKEMVLQNEVINFISKNIEKLHAHYKQDLEDDKYQITLPPPDKTGETYELQVIEKSTGKVVRTLARVYKLFENQSISY